jgi:DNA-binding GntR family transcriptional regulator
MQMLIGLARRAPTPSEDIPVSVADRVAIEIMQALEQQRFVPGQRLIETYLAAQFGVGRNAVREAIQGLAARGIVDLSRHCWPSIRLLGLDEVLEVLDVAEVMTGFLARTAASNFETRAHKPILRAAMNELKTSEIQDRVSFSRARRRFYRALLNISGNRELDHLFSALHMQIVYAQYQTRRLQNIRFADYRAIGAAVGEKNCQAAENLGRQHVKHVRCVIIELASKEMNQTPP